MTTVPTWQSQCGNLRVVEGLNETSNPLQAIADIARGTMITLQCYHNVRAKTGRSLIESWLHDVPNDIRYHWNFTLKDLYVVLGLAFIWSVARVVLAKGVFEVFAKRSGMMERYISKFGESMWKVVAYGFMWLAAVYVTFFRGYDFFQRSVQLWTDQNSGNYPFDLTALYAIETSFYAHSIYATLYMDVWRKDSLVMLIHHFVTLALIIPSYAVGFLKIGVLIFVLDDVSDVILESGKALSYMRYRKSGFSPFLDAICNVTGVLFAVQWAVLRLQMHLTKVWRSAAIGLWVSHPVLPVPFHLFFVIFLGSLYLFYAYWFAFIMLFVVRIVQGRKGPAEDPREEEELKEAQLANGQQNKSKAD